VFQKNGQQLLDVALPLFFVTGCKVHKRLGLDATSDLALIVSFEKTVKSVEN